MSKEENIKEKGWKSEFILDESNQKVYNKMQKALKLPMFAQKYLYGSSEMPKHYSAKIIAEKEDRISVVDAVYQLRIGANGLFIKRNPIGTLGVTYYKKGRSSSRIKCWGVSNDRWRSQKSGQHREIIRDLGKLVVPDAEDLLNNNQLMIIATPGLIGSIFSKKITSVQEAMQYYIRYSMRGMGIKQESAMNLYRFMNKLSTHDAISTLRCAKDPNKLLEQFQCPDDVIPKTIASRINRHGHQLNHMANGSSETIDWVDEHFDYDAVAERLSTKERRIKEFLELWEGGPVLKSKYKTQSSNTFDITI